MSEPYVPAVIPPDPDRDARVAGRRAEDARRAGRALDRLLAPIECGPGWVKVRCTMWPHDAHGECSGVRG